MKIIRPYMKMFTNGCVGTPDNHTLGALNFINWCGRVSHRSEDAPSDIERFLRHVVIEKGDWSITEHANVSVDAIVDRGITHEIVRHRIAAYTQESTRFVNYAKKMPPSFIYPDPSVECRACLEGYDATDKRNAGKFWWHDDVDGLDINCHNCQYDDDWVRQIQSCEATYKSLLKKGWKPEIARSVFPNALSSRIIITMNLRSWRHFFLMRTSKQAHPQMRQVTIPLLAEFQAAIPVLYEDIVPESTQIDNLRKGR